MVIRCPGAGTTPNTSRIQYAVIIDGGRSLEGIAAEYNTVRRFQVPPYLVSNYGQGKQPASEIVHSNTVECITSIANRKVAIAR